MTLINFKNRNGLSNHPTLRGLSFPSLFNDSLDRFFTDESINWMPSVNIKERAEDFRIDLAVPGMDKNDFKVEVENDLLVVSGERKEEKGEENEKHTRREFHYGTFKRSFSLPETADSENVKANYKDGILSLIIVKKEESKQKAKRQISID